MSFKVGCLRNLWLDGNELWLPCIYKFYNVSFPLTLFLTEKCSVVLFPVAVTFFVTWWFIQFVDGFFSPLYERLGIDIFGKFNILLGLSISFKALGLQKWSIIQLFFFRLLLPQKRGGKKRTRCLIKILVLSREKPHRNLLTVTLQQYKDYKMEEIQLFFFKLVLKKKGSKKKKKTRCLMKLLVLSWKNPHKICWN